MAHTPVGSNSTAHVKPKRMSPTHKRPQHAARRKAAKAISPFNPLDLDPQVRRGMIETAAYFLAENRQFAPGFELDDWCAAEQAIDAQLRTAAQLTDGLR